MVQKVNSHELHLRMAHGFNHLYYFGTYAGTNKR
jgi:hypothetical protein